MGKVFIFLLLGGFVGPDGYAVSPGILILAHRLRTFGEVSTHNWSARDDVTQRIAALAANDKVVLIGYSLGGLLAPRAAALSGNMRNAVLSTIRPMFGASTRAA